MLDLICSGISLADEYCTDPKYEEEVSGCTATVGIITHDKVYVVCLVRTPRLA